MDTPVIDFVPWGIDASWPSRCWVEPINGRRGQPSKGARLGHSNAKAMVLVCSYPRLRFDQEVARSGADPVRELAYETTFALVNLALHQIRVPGARPDGLVGSLVQFAGQQANRHRDWATTRWGEEIASITGMAGWQSGFSLGYPDVYVVVHACGVDIGELQLKPVPDITGYDLTSDPLEIGAMIWELWRTESSVQYKDLARVLVMP